MFISIFKDFEKKRKFSISPIKIPNKPKPKILRDEKKQTEEQSNEKGNNEKDETDQNTTEKKAKPDTQEEDEDDVDLI
jgi:hypothetical protein